MGQQGLGARARARVCSWMLSMVTVPSPSTRARARVCSWCLNRDESRVASRVVPKI